MKKRVNFRKKKLILGVLILLAILLSIVGGINLTKYEKMLAFKGEHARAMTYGELDESDELTNSEFVKFSAFFLRDIDLDGYANKIKGTAKEIGTSDTLYMALSIVENGTFKNGNIEIIGENFYFQTALIDDEVISGNYINANTTSIDLKELEVGTQKLIFGNVRSGNYSNGQTTAAIGNDTTKYSRINKIILTGIHEKSDGTQTVVEKEIELPVDWYGTLNAEIPNTYAGKKNNKYQNYDFNKILETLAITQTVDVEFTITAQETKNKLNLSKSYMEGQIPTLAGYDPINVEIKGNNIVFTYDEQNRNFTITKDSVINANNEIIADAYTGQYSNTRYNEYKFKVSYPLEAYNALGIDSLNLSIPVKAYYEAYNNPNDEFENPIKSNVAEEIVNVIYELGGGNIITFDMNTGSWVQNPYGAWIVSKQPVDYAYNYKEQPDFEYQDDIYQVMWQAARGSDGRVSSIRLEEPDSKYYDEIITSSNNRIQMTDISTNIGIYFIGAGRVLKENGYINLYNDETNELIHTFTINDWDLYTELNPYKYDTEINHIRIETSEMFNGNLYVYNIKKINDEILISRFTEQEFENFKKIESHVSPAVKTEPDDDYVEVDDVIKSANYDYEKSIMSIVEIEPDYFSTQEIKENAIIRFRTSKLPMNTSEWINGAFLVKLPREILAFDVNNITISDSNVSLLGYSVEEKEDGFYLKILTENSTPAVYDIIIDYNIAPDPRILSSEKIIEIYGVNENAKSYLSEVTDEYDIDGDGNTQEPAAKVSSQILLIGPTSLITMETVTEHNIDNDRLETIIAPQIAVVDKTQDDRTVTIKSSLLNNYSGIISEIKIVGKIPFEGNAYQLINKNLGSEYTTKLVDKINLSDDLKSFAKVYYSENTNVNENLEDETNNWIAEENITDFSNVKCYLIDLGSYIMPVGSEQSFEYEIEIPNDVSYNETTYSTHAAYFSLNTNEGKLKDRIETNKLGFMIARKYDLEINKNKKGQDDNFIKGAVFSITEEGALNSTKILSTDINGRINLTNLHVDRTYVIKEIKSPYDFVLNEQEIKIKVVVNEETDELEVIKIQGNTKNNIEVEAREPRETVIVNIENEPKYTFSLTTLNQETGEGIRNAKFRITGKGMPTTGRTVVTNVDGVINVSGLYPGETYTIVEENAKGYEYTTYPAVFRTVWNGNELVPELLDGGFSSALVIDNNQIAQPIMSTTLTNIKLREYSFELNKYEKNTEKVLENAMFKITGKWADERLYTDVNGSIKLPVLYEGIEYTVEEMLAPEGYMVSENKIKFVGSFDENGNLQINISEGELITSRDSSENTNGNIYDANGNLVTDKEANISLEDGIYIFKLGFEDEPLFKLTKIDGDTNEPLANVKFTIKKVEDDGREVIAIDTKGNIIGEEYDINGETYRVIITDEKGQITASLPEGIYKVVEVEALEEYKFEEDISKRSYTFGIGRSKPAKYETSEEFEDMFYGYGAIDYTIVIPAKMVDI